MEPAGNTDSASPRRVSGGFYRPSKIHRLTNTYSVEISYTCYTVRVGNENMPARATRERRGKYAGHLCSCHQQGGSILELLIRKRLQVGLCRTK